MTCLSSDSVKTAPTIIGWIILLIQIAITGSFIKFMFFSSKSTDNDKSTPKAPKYVGSTLSVISFISLVIYISYVHEGCNWSYEYWWGSGPSSISSSFDLIFAFYFCFGLQQVMMFLLWILVLYYALKETPLQISITVRFIVGFFILVLFLAGFSILYLNDNDNYESYMFILAAAVYLLLLLLVFIIFIILISSKLCKVHNKHENNAYNEDLIRMITKIGTLYFTTFFITLILWILPPFIDVYSYYGSSYTYRTPDDFFIVYLLYLSINIFLNFVCMILTFVNYHKCYRILCKLQDTCCVCCCRCCSFVCCCRCCRCKECRRIKNAKLAKRKADPVALNKLSDLILKEGKSKHNILKQLKKYKLNLHFNLRLQMNITKPHINTTKLAEIVNKVKDQMQFVLLHMMNSYKLEAAINGYYEMILIIYALIPAPRDYCREAMSVLYHWIIFSVLFFIGTLQIIKTHIIDDKNTLSCTNMIKVCDSILWLFVLFMATGDLRPFDCYVFNEFSFNIPIFCSAILFTVIDETVGHFNSKLQKDETDMTQLHDGDEVHHEDISSILDEMTQNVNDDDEAMTNMEKLDILTSNVQMVGSNAVYKYFDQFYYYFDKKFGEYLRIAAYYAFITYVCDIFISEKTKAFRFWILFPLFVFISLASMIMKCGDQSNPIWGFIFCVSLMIAMEPFEVGGLNFLTAFSLFNFLTALSLFISFVGHIWGPTLYKVYCTPTDDENKAREVENVVSDSECDNDEAEIDLKIKNVDEKVVSNVEEVEEVKDVEMESRQKRGQQKSVQIPSVAQYKQEEAQRNQHQGKQKAVRETQKQKKEAPNIEEQKEKHPLPNGWRVVYTANRKKYYQNDITKVTQYNAPTVNMSTGTDDLPPGWKTMKSSDGRIYYQNEENKTTQWEHPLKEARNSSSASGSMHYAYKEEEEAPSHVNEERKQLEENVVRKAQVEEEQQKQLEEEALRKAIAQEEEIQRAQVEKERIKLEEEALRKALVQEEERIKLEQETLRKAEEEETQRKIREERIREEKEARDQVEKERKALQHEREQLEDERIRLKHEKQREMNQSVTDKQKMEAMQLQIDQLLATSRGLQTDLEQQKQKDKIMNNQQSLLSHKLTSLQMENQSRNNQINALKTELSTLKQPKENDAMPATYYPSFSTGVYGVYALKSLYRPSLSTGVYGVYALNIVDIYAYDKL